MHQLDSRQQPQQQAHQQSHPHPTDMSLEAASLAAQQLMSQQHTGHQESHPYLPTPGDIMAGMRGVPAHLMGLDDADLALVTGMTGGPGHTSGSKRRNRGSRLDDIIKTEQDGLDCDDRWAAGSFYKCFVALS